MATRRPSYHSYLLRIWQSDENGRLVWRASLESTGDGQLRAFADLESLFAFLLEESGSLQPGDNSEPGQTEA